jgi:hypothetical protein
LSPIRTPFRVIDCLATQTLLPINIGYDFISHYLPKTVSVEVICESLSEMQTPGPNIQLSPISNLVIAKSIVPFNQQLLPILIEENLL